MKRYTKTITLLDKKNEAGLFENTITETLLDIKQLPEVTLSLVYEGKKRTPKAIASTYKHVTVYIDTALIKGNDPLEKFIVGFKTWENVQDAIIKRYNDLQLINQ